MEPQISRQEVDPDQWVVWDEEAEITPAMLDSLQGFVSHLTNKEPT